MLLKKLIRVPILIVFTLCVELFVLNPIFLAVYFSSWLFEDDTPIYKTMREDLTEPLYTKIKEDLNV